MIHRKYDSRSIFVSKFHINAINFNEIEFSVNWPLTFCDHRPCRVASRIHTTVTSAFVSMLVTSVFVLVFATCHFCCCHVNILRVAVNVQVVYGRRSTV